MLTGANPDRPSAAPDMTGWTPEQRTERDRQETVIRAGFTALAEASELVPYFDLYADIKDHYHGLRPSDLTPACRAAFRAIREGSSGKLFNPPVL